MPVLLEILLRCLAQVIGGLAAALVTVAVLWSVFKLIRRPEWAGPFVVLVTLSAAGGIPKNPFLQMMVFFAMVASAVVWHEGKAWRRRRKLYRMFGLPGGPHLNRKATTYRPGDKRLEQILQGSKI